MREIIWASTANRRMKPALLASSGLITFTATSRPTEGW